MLIVMAQFVSWLTCAPWGDYIVSLSWRLIGGVCPNFPFGISFSVLLDIMYHKKEEVVTSFGPKPRSSIICTCCLVGFPPFREVKAVHRRTELRWWARERPARGSSEKRNDLGKKLTFLALPVQIAVKSR